MNHRYAIVLAAVLAFFVGGFSDGGDSAQAAPGLPDLRVIDLGFDPYVLVQTEDFPADDCSVVEGLIDAGTHRLMRFHTVTGNFGVGDLKLGRPRQGDPNWEFFTCHNHWHFKHYADYTLLDASWNVVGQGHKQSFCIEDGFRLDFQPPYRPRYTCDRQGLQPGYGDDYSLGLVGQWIVIDNVPAGNYTLSQTVDPLNVLAESDDSNNTLLTSVMIP